MINYTDKYVLLHRPESLELPYPKQIGNVDHLFLRLCNLSMRNTGDISMSHNIHSVCGMLYLTCDVITTIIIIITQTRRFIFKFTVINVDCFNNVFLCVSLLFYKLTLYYGM